jgi:DNA-binding Lrp family transcriptional regulator
MMPLHTSEEHIVPMPRTDARRDAVLEALDAAGGEATCGELAAATGLSNSTVRNALRRLEWAKDIERVGLQRSTKHTRARFRRVMPGTPSAGSAASALLVWLLTALVRAAEARTWA